MKKKILIIFSISLVILFLCVLIFKFLFFPKDYKNYVVAYSEEFGLEKALVYSVIKVESDFDSNAISRSGALGLMQMLPATAKWIAKELGEEYSDENMFEPKTNIRYGCFYLKYLFDKFKKMDIVICAYNAGEGKVFDWIEDGEIVREKIDYKETLNYLVKVENFYRVYKNEIINF